MKILVSGSAGFIFSNFIIYALQETKWDLVSVDKLTYAGSLANIAHNNTIHNKRHKLYIGDVCDYHFVQKIFEIEKPDIVIHGAAESFVDKSIDNSYDFIQTNVIGTHSMLESALHVHTPKLFVNFSTDECYGQILEGSFTEMDRLDPRNPYSASKASADLLGQSYYTTHGVPIITTRCCNVFGSRQNKEKLIPKVITNILTDKKIPVFGQGAQIREWIYVKDVFNAILCIIENGTVGEIYNISSGVHRTNLDLIRFICNNFGHREDLIEFVKDRKGHDFRYSINSDKLKSLGWETKYDFENAVLHTANWYKANPWSWNT
jgi:dTDP-glucose 4,6-dehydratase